jgi:hypothetical protein
MYCEIVTFHFFLVYVMWCDMIWLTYFQLPSLLLWNCYRSPKSYQLAYNWTNLQCDIVSWLLPQLLLLLVHFVVGLSCRSEKQKLEVERGGMTSPSPQSSPMPPPQTPSPMGPPQQSPSPMASPSGMPPPPQAPSPMGPPQHHAHSPTGYNQGPSPGVMHLNGPSGTSQHAMTSGTQTFQQHTMGMGHPQPGPQVSVRCAGSLWHQQLCASKLIHLLLMWMLCFINFIQLWQGDK